MVFFKVVLISSNKVLYFVFKYTSTEKFEWVICIVIVQMVVLLGAVCSAKDFHIFQTVMVLRLVPLIPGTVYVG